MSKVPEIRFKGFTDAWEQREFLELVNKLSKTSISENLPKIEFEDIISGEGRLNKDVSAKFDNRKGILFNENNILYGKLRPYLKNWLYTDFKGIALGDFWVFEAKNIEPKFLYFLIQADIYQKAANDTSGTKMPRSDWQKVSSTKFYIPRDLEEQIKIGNLLWEIEETLTLHQRKLEQLQQTKTAFLQKMFPQPGMLAPEQRFPKFSENWNSKKLGDFTRLITKGTTPKDKSGVGEVNMIKIENISNGKINPTNQISFKEHETNLKRSKLIEKDILFSIAGTLGRTALVTESILPANTNQALAIIRDYDFDSIFLTTYLSGPKLKTYIKSNPTVGAQPNLSLEQINNITVTAPSTQEQKRIGQLFLKIDQVINLHQRELELLKQTKQGFLQKMFPKGE
ncbi:restriction endonuclease subunit S [Macrococcus brunensis]|uniref:restriction endonuclease subunit S n=1 Tax=Macrococcus brunensis TaxID=198483 RepID=UPI001EEFCA24|nr:restriction endonuclease subunit S [Macrococcus brunensis]ULG74220.1 restriction endonuclease subunit S [Macrococcus brunensis]